MKNSVISALVFWSLAGLDLGAGPMQAGGADAASGRTRPLVLVAGVTGRTGQEVVRQLLAEGYQVRGLVRDRKRAGEIFGSSIQYAVGDVREVPTLGPAMQGAAYVICAIGSSRDDPANSPEQVDYLGVRNLVDAARAAGVRQFVLMSSMGTSRLQSGRAADPPHPARAEVARWKLQGENHLRASGLTYTIVRPGGLNENPGGRQGIIVQQGDRPMDGDPRLRMIPRADVAAVMIRALGNPEADNRTFEIMGNSSAPPPDWSRFFTGLARD